MSEAPEQSLFPMEAALAYAARGWPVLPIWHADADGNCACGVQTCPSPGKHPRTKQKATVDAEQIKRWWTGWPTANVAIVTGSSSGVSVIDVNTDSKKRLQDIEAQHGTIPPTMEARSGSGGRHIHVVHLPGFNPPPDILGDGITVHGEGSYIIMPPSMHYRSVAYEWLNPPGTPLASMPEWLVKAEQARLDAMVFEAHKTIPVITGPRSASFEEACELYIKHNMMRSATWLPFPKVPGPCPICSGSNTFSAHPMENRWKCTSPQHADGGRRQGNCFWGDVIDIDASHRNRTRKRHLEAEGYTGKSVKIAENKERFEQRKATASYGNAALASVTVLHPQKKEQHALTNSFASLVEILSNTELSRSVLCERPLGYNEFSHSYTMGRRLIDDDDISDLMVRIELNHTDVKSVGLTYSAEAVKRAVQRVARNRPYHPVREYLDALKWDGVSRLEDVPHDVLNAENSDINRSWFKRWMISAVARVRSPGCQADHMLVLVHPRGGEGKSTFFRILGGAWFADDVIDVHDTRKASHAVQGKWIYEWAEMESLVRARDAGPANAFIVKRTDNYLPPYGHFMVDWPRQGIFGGTTNKPEFMRERGGRRRFWPITVGDSVDLKAAERLRDQWWAEADALFQKGEQWHPTEGEKSLIADVHEIHTSLDPWEAIVIPWLNKRHREHWVGNRKELIEVPQATTVAVKDILQDALQIDPGRWSRAEENRIGEILRAAGWEPFRGVAADGARPRLWRKTDA